MKIFNSFLSEDLLMWKWFRYFLLRDVYDDMLLDGVQPIRDTFHTLILGAMKGARLQDALYFMDEMKSMGLKPDVSYFLYKLLLLL
jgi:pentatricopeptide repeat protein